MNQVSLIGRLTKDPECKVIEGSGKQICNFSLAVPRRGKKDEADFVNCVAFGKTAETITKYLGKGRRISIVGALHTGSYDAKDGTKRYTTDVIVQEFGFLDTAPKNQNDDIPFDEDIYNQAI